MIFEILLRLSLHALHYPAELWTGAFACGVLLLIVQFRSDSAPQPALPLRQALGQALQVTRAVRQLFTVAAFAIVMSAYLLVAGLWKEWLVAAAAAVVWHWLPTRRQRPTA